ncbi:hypothetical protein HT136_05780 [Novosphingobium profundi]|uniref:hypothetical protein n=1 Tax=Novosphingobium profundi TaxID=1774954 RepID=UPI001BDA05CD|nr:hypothetical protein [Novosphingobium profundi]MBT0667875.1 hypothetical protein [Novosphingobium profundi]
MTRTKASTSRRRTISAIPLCWLNRHTPDREHAQWDGKHFVSTCTQCNAPIRRRKKNVWLKDWLDDEPQGATPTPK